MAQVKVGCDLCEVWKPPLAGLTHCVLGAALSKNSEPSAMAGISGDSNRFVVAFCGSGTGHLTQAMAVVDMLKKRGMILAGVVTDDDMSQRMIDEMVTPLGVEMLVLPAITLIDTERGFMPLVRPHVFTQKLMSAQAKVAADRHRIAAFFQRVDAGRIFCFWHITLARFFEHNPLSPGITVTHIAAQFGLCALTYPETKTPIEVLSKATMDLMADIFKASGPTIAISPLAGDTGAGLPPIVHVPAPIAPKTPRLILCYFLVQTNATQLDALLARSPMPGVEFHCFTQTPLERPRSTLQSHAKQRKLFQVSPSPSQGQSPGPAPAPTPASAPAPTPAPHRRGALRRTSSRAAPA